MTDLRFFGSEELTINRRKFNFLDMTELQKARFWSKVEVSRDARICWPWRAGKLTSGYGRFRVNMIQYNATHIAWTLINGREVPEGLHMLHSCDNPICVNPNHLRPGTCADNMQDKKDRKRGKYSRHPIRQKLTDEEVRSIFFDRRTYKVIAAEYGISAPLVCNIKKGRDRANITGPLLKDQMEAA